MFLLRTSAGLGSILGSEVRIGGFSFSGAKFGVISLNGQVRACGILQFGVEVPMFLLRTSAGLGSILGSEVWRGGFLFSGAKFGAISLNGQVR